MQNREEVKRLLANADLVYSFENSSIVTEAILSGTPTRFVDNPFLGEVIAEVELGQGGVVQEDTEEAIQAAKETVDDGIEQYYKKINEFHKDLSEFIITTQARAREFVSDSPVFVPEVKHLVNAHRISLSVQILKTQGLRVLFRVIYHFIMRRLSWRYWMKSEK